MTENGASGMEKIFHGLKLISFCGGGAYGEVWYCEDISGRLMAVKIISKKKLGAHWERELRGVRNYCRITENNPALLQIFHVEEDEEFFFYTMEPADSLTPETYSPDTLAARLQRGPVAADELYRILSAVFDGMKAIHCAGFSHRDIKPDNILFVKGVPKLADIGLLSSLSASMTQLAGTLEFIPPEERTAENIEYSAPAARQRNDLYALGKVIYCTVTGNSPSDYPAVPPTMTVSLPVKLFLRLAFQLCRKEPEGRLDSIEEVAAEFSAIKRKLANGETLSDHIADIFNSGRLEFKSILKSSGKILRKFWYLFLLFLLLGGGCAYWILKPEPPFDITKQKTKKYVNKEHGVSLDIPVEWEVLNTEAAVNFLMAYHRDDENLAENLKEIRAKKQDIIRCGWNSGLSDYITIIVKNKGLLGSVSVWFNNLKATVGGAYKKNVKNISYQMEKNIGYNGVAVGRYYVDYSFLSGRHTRSYFFTIDNKVFEIRLNCEGSTFQQREEEFNSILKTLKIKK